MSSDYYGAMAGDIADAGDSYDGICPACGYDEHCGCPADTHTMAKMRCPSCGGQWWRGWGDTSTRCLHKQCGAEGSEVVREPLYAPHDAVTSRSAAADAIWLALHAHDSNGYDQLRSHVGELTDTALDDLYDAAEVLCDAVSEERGRRRA